MIKPTRLKGLCGTWPWDSFCCLWLFVLSAVNVVLFPSPSQRLYMLHIAICQWQKTISQFSKWFIDKYFFLGCNINTWIWLRWQTGNQWYTCSHTALLFIDLSKASDCVARAVLKHRLHCLGLSDHAVSWFANYSSDRRQCVKCVGLCSEVLRVHKGVPQGSALGPLLFVMYIIALGQNIRC